MSVCDILLQVHQLKQKEMRKMLQQGLLPLRDGILQVSKHLWLYLLECYHVSDWAGIL
jgi:hypothetical protein